MPVFFWNNLYIKLFFFYLLKKTKNETIIPDGLVLYGFRWMFKR